MIRLNILPGMRISFSALETFQQCPLKYKFSQIDRIRVPKSPEAVFGSAIHSVLKYFHGSPALPTLEELLNYYKVVWPQSGLVKWRTAEEEKIYFDQGTSILEKYYAKHAPLEFTIVDLETRFEAPLEAEDNQRHTLSGIIDRIDKLADGSWEIIDYKTTKRMPAQLDVDSNLQLAIYLLGARARWPNLKIPQIKLSLYFLRHGEKLSAFMSEGQIESTRRRILELIGKIQAKSADNDFPPTPSALCGWCGYRSDCPMWKHESVRSNQDLKINQIIKEFFKIRDRSSENEVRLSELKKEINNYFDRISEEFIGLQNQVDRDEDRVSELKKAINIEYDENGLERAFASDGSYITRSLQQRFSYDEKRIKEILTTNGLWERVSTPTLDISKLKEIAKSLPRGLWEEIEKAKTVKKFKVLKVVLNKFTSEGATEESEKTGSDSETNA